MVVIVVVLVVVAVLALGVSYLQRPCPPPQPHPGGVVGDRRGAERRHGLIPNLVNTVQGYASHERQTFEALTAARAGAVSAGATGDPTKVASAEGTLSQSLRSLFAAAENLSSATAMGPL